MQLGRKNTQAAIKERFDVDDRGTIRTLGRFEGQPAYIAWMWELCMLGRVREIRGIYYIDIYASDVAEWPALHGRQSIMLRQREDGSVTEVNE